MRSRGGTIFNVVRSLAGTFGGAVIGGVLTVRERVHSFYLTAHLVTGAPSTVRRQSAEGLGRARHGGQGAGDDPSNG